MSSSGFVPAPFSNLVLNEYCVLDRTPLAVETVPLPSFSPPFHCALAVLCMILLLDEWKVKLFSIAGEKRCRRRQEVEDDDFRRFLRSRRSAAHSEGQAGS